MPDESRAIRIGRILNEYHDQRRCGASLSESELLAAHPDLADDLRLCLAPCAELGKARIAPPGIVIPQTIGEFQVIGFVGMGGMGIVYKAMDPALGRTIALKVLRPEYADDPVAMRRFSREARAAASLKHANIVAVHSVAAAAADVPFIAMEFIDGPTLAQVIANRGALPTETVRHFFRQILIGLADAHNAGLIHRDVKSANIMLDRNQLHIKITDFGLALAAAAQTRITMPASIMGTVEYMSPEQARGDENIDQRTDLYSAGVVLYEMLTGRSPFAASTAAGVIHRIQNDEPAHPRILDKCVDPHLASLAMRLMAKRPSDRLETAEIALDELLAGSPVPSIEKRRRRLRWVAVFSLALIVATGTVWRLCREPEIIDVKVDNERDALVKVRYQGHTDWRIFKRYDPAHPAKSAAIVHAVWGPCVVVTASKTFGIKNEVVQAIAPTGMTLWTAGIFDAFVWPGLTTPDENSWIAKRVREFDVDGIAGQQLAMISASTLSDPSRLTIYRVDIDGLTPLQSFLHYGHLRDFFIVDDFFGEREPGIVVLGQNDVLDEVPEEVARGEVSHTAAIAHEMVNVVFILKPGAMDGQCPLSPAKDLPPIPVCNPVAYAYLNMPVTLENLNPSLESRSADMDPFSCGTHFPFITFERNAEGQIEFELSIHEFVEIGGAARKSRCTLRLDSSLKLIDARPTDNEVHKHGTNTEFWRNHWVSVYRDSMPTDEWKGKLKEGAARSRSLP
ncbi:MAG: serine/threonine protein kinase [Phycisphaerales bacterium]|nr:serine/threonine protein kinase [Phycisphaerales bacterium]MCB9856261.1 serine/threonine protein kinase [Phycisphaerales bacterium]MCB9863300.1 serine/threonine protein kinase [Phycisphaerales bacterium]